MVRALEDRPLTTGTVPGRLGEWFNLVAPRLSDAAYHRIDRRVPDSRAARGKAPRAVTHRWSAQELLDLVLDEGSFESWDEPIDISDAAAGLPA